MAEKSLIQFILDLLRDPQALEKFQDDPKSFMSACGLSTVSPEQVHDALAVIQDNDHSDFSRDYNTGGNHVAGASIPPPPPASHHEPDAGVKYLDKYITNNYVTNNVDDRDTIIDQSVNQHIDTGGGDFDQTIDNHSVNATGDGAVAAGGDIDGSTITTGNGNAVGAGSQAINGDNNSTAFGEGSTAVRDVEVGKGGAFAVNGDAAGNASTNDSYNKTQIEDNDTTKIHDSYNQESDSSSHVNVDDHSHNDFLSHNHVDASLAL